VFACFGEWRGLTWSVSMPEYAKDSLTGALVKASDASKHGKYVCVCPDKHAVFLRKGLERAAHFAHFSVEGGREVTCRGGGESEEHMEAKHRLVEMQGQYKFALKRCMECGKCLWEDCGGGGKLDVEVRSQDKRWIYDVLLTRSDGTQLALEVYHTHASGEEKLESSALIGVPIAEFLAEDILGLTGGGGGVLLNLQCDREWICGDECADRKRRREAAEREKKLEEMLEENRRREAAARIACERAAGEQEAEIRLIVEESDRMAGERKRQREEEMAVAMKIESHKRRQGEKLYYHCEFNGRNNTCYWAPLGQGVRSYGEVYACGGVMME